MKLQPESTDPIEMARYNGYMKGLIDAEALIPEFMHDLKFQILNLIHNHEKDTRNLYDILDDSTTTGV